MNAGYDKDVQEVQLKVATDRNVHGILHDTYTRGKMKIPVADLVKSELGRAIYADKRANGGPGGAISLLKPVVEKYYRQFKTQGPKQTERTKVRGRRGGEDSFAAYLRSNQPQIEKEFIEHGSKHWRAGKKIAEFEKLSGTTFQRPKEQRGKP